MLDRIDALTADIAELDAPRSKQVIGPYAAQVAQLDEVTGIGATCAQEIIAEIGVDMTVFPTAAHLASWAKFAPDRQPVRRQRPRAATTGKGNPWLASTLGEIAAVLARTDTFLGERYRRLSRRRGKNTRHRRDRQLGPHRRLAPARRPRPPATTTSAPTSTTPAYHQRRQHNLIRQLEHLTGQQGHPHRPSRASRRLTNHASNPAPVRHNHRGLRPGAAACPLTDDFRVSRDACVRVDSRAESSATPDQRRAHWRDYDQGLCRYRCGVVRAFAGRAATTANDAGRAASPVSVSIGVAGSTPASAADRGTGRTSYTRTKPTTYAPCGPRSAAEASPYASPAKASSPPRNWAGTGGSSSPAWPGYRTTADSYAATNARPTTSMPSPTSATPYSATADSPKTTIWNEP